MLIHIIFSVFIACGEGRSAHFISHSTKSVVPNGRRPYLVRCAVGCIANGSCLSFYSDIRAKVCTLSTEHCGTFEGDSICYRRQNSERMSTDRNKTKLSSINKTDLKSEIKGDPRPQKGSARLLLIPFYQNHTVLELDLKTKSIQKYHNDQLKFVVAVTYMPRSSRLLLCMGKPPQIVISTLNGDQKVLLNRHASALAVDERSNFIFLADRVVHRMLIDGSHLKSIKRERKVYPVKLATDFDKKLLYVSYGSCIYVLAYSGMPLRTLDRSSYIKALYFDKESKVLYYNKDLALMRVNSTHIIEVRKLATIDISIDVYKNTVYVASTGGNLCEFDGVDVAKNSPCKKIPYEPKLSSLIMCVVKS